MLLRHMPSAARLLYAADAAAHTLAAPIFHAICRLIFDMAFHAYAASAFCHAYALLP